MTAGTVTQESVACLVHHDDGREYVFDGVKLGEASSWEPSKLRWFEISIYRNAAGGYIVHKVGRSVVYHRAMCASINGRDDLVGVDEPGVDREPCPKCQPDLTHDPVMLERDKNFVHEAATVEGMIESLYQTDDQQVRYMPKTAKAALRFARQRDEEVMRVFTTRSL